jgi:hypothetical protein
MSSGAVIEMGDLTVTTGKVGTTSHGGENTISLPVHPAVESGTRGSMTLPVRVDFPPRSLEPIPPEEARQRIADLRRHLTACLHDLETAEHAYADQAEGRIERPSGISPTTIRMAAACLSEMLKLEWAQPHREYCPDLCKLLDCPQQPILRHAVCEAIEVLESTKWRFKSKALKDLRENLLVLLKNSDRSLPDQET